MCEGEHGKSTQYAFPHRVEQERKPRVFGICGVGKELLLLHEIKGLNLEDFIFSFVRGWVAAAASEGATPHFFRSRVTIVGGEMFWENEQKRRRKDLFFRQKYTFQEISLVTAFDRALVLIYHSHVQNWRKSAREILSRLILLLLGTV